MMVKELPNLELVKGLCSVCRREIDKKWSEYGSTCRSHADVELFGSHNVDVAVKKTVQFNPLLGMYDYKLDFAGSRVKINGQITTVVGADGTGCTVEFPDGSKEGVFGLSWRALYRIYTEEGGEVEPPPPNFSEHVASKASLLDEPLASVVTINHQNRVDGATRSVGVVSQRALWFNQLIGRWFHPFVNLYVRYKFGLRPNSDYHAMGGFIGHGFVASHSRDVIGFDLKVNPVPESLEHLSDKEFHSHVMREGLLGILEERMMEREWELQEHPAVPATVEEVVSAWVSVMETLLRYDWSRYSIDSDTWMEHSGIGWAFLPMDVETTWQLYCDVQDVLVNIIPEEELKKVLSFSTIKRKGPRYY